MGVRGQAGAARRRPAATLADDLDARIRLEQPDGRHAERGVVILRPLTPYWHPRPNLLPPRPYWGDRTGKPTRVGARRLVHEH